MSPRNIEPKPCAVDNVLLPIRKLHQANEEIAALKRTKLVKVGQQTPAVTPHNIGGVEVSQQLAKNGSHLGRQFTPENGQSRNMPHGFNLSRGPVGGSEGPDQVRSEEQLQVWRDPDAQIPDVPTTNHEGCRDGVPVYHNRVLLGGNPGFFKKNRGL